MPETLGRAKPLRGDKLVSVLRTRKKSVMEKEGNYLTNTRRKERFRKKGGKEGRRPRKNGGKLGGSKRTPKRSSKLLAPIVLANEKREKRDRMKTEKFEDGSGENGGGGKRSTLTRWEYQRTIHKRDSPWNTKARLQQGGKMPSKGTTSMGEVNQNNHRIFVQNRVKRKGKRRKLGRRRGRMRGSNEMGGKRG